MLTLQLINTTYISKESFSHCYNAYKPQYNIYSKYLNFFPPSSPMNLHIRDFLSFDYLQNFRVWNQHMNTFRRKTSTGIFTWKQLCIHFCQL